MKYLIIVILFSLLSVSFLGFINMNHGDMNCDITMAAITAGDCPESITSMVFHHITTYTAFSNIIVNNATTSLISMLLLMLPITFLFMYYLFSDPYSHFTYLNPRQKPDFGLEKRRKIYRWLSLLENSPSM